MHCNDYIFMKLHMPVTFLYYRSNLQLQLKNSLNAFFFWIQRAYKVFWKLTVVRHNKHITRKDGCPFSNPIADCLDVFLGALCGRVSGYVDDIAICHLFFCLEPAADAQGHAALDESAVAGNCCRLATSIHYRTECVC